MLKILSFFIYTNIIVSLSAWSLYKITEILFNFYNYNLGMFVFFSTLLAYNYMRLPFFSSLETERSKWIHDNINFIYCDSCLKKFQKSNFVTNPKKKLQF